jgi:hypothetical protein
MTEQQVIERLANRHGPDARMGCFDCDPCLSGKPHQCAVGGMVVFDYLGSRDALAPVLEGLSEIDWRKLVDVVFDMWAATPTAPSAVRYILTLPPRDLAFAIAEALEETQL